MDVASSADADNPVHKCTVYSFSSSSSPSPLPPVTHKTPFGPFNATTLPLYVALQVPYV